jgi:hypothetical protein
MPFGDYTTFERYDLTDQTTFSRYVTYEAYGSRGFTKNYGNNQSKAETSSGFSNGSYDYQGGSINATSTVGSTNHSESGYTLDLQQGYFVFSGSGGTTTDYTNLSKASFIENQGFEETYGYNQSTTYYFSDYTDQSYFDLSRSHGQTTASIDLRQTSSTELTIITPIGDSTTYSQITGYITNLDRSFTSATSIAEYGTAIAHINTCNKVIGLGYVIFPIAGPYWTADGTGLMYRRLFTDTGTYGEYYTSIFKDNAESATTITPTESYLSANGTAQGDEIVTLFSDESGVITYDVTLQQSETFTIGKSYDFINNKFILNTDMGSTSYWYKPYITSSELSYTNQYGATIGPFGDSDGDSWVIGGVISSTKLINVDTTISSFLYSFKNTKSTYISYRKLGKTISTLSYILHDYETDTWGSSTSLSSYQTANTNISPIFDETVEISGSGFTNESYIATYYPKLSKKCFYSLQYYSSINPTYFTQKSPNFNWVVADSANLSAATKYFNSLSPSNALTKLYFTTYKYHRYGIVNAPIFAVPIDFTEESDSSYTYQVVGIPSNFYFGSDPASATQTYSVLNEATLTTSSFTIGYAGQESSLKMARSGPNDMSGGGDPSYYENIFHTIAVEQNSSDCASWSMDNYYYWSGASSRIISGSASNPISIIGDYHPFTVIASEWGSDAPYLAIDVTYRNSYSY